MKYKENEINAVRVCNNYMIININPNANNWIMILNEEERNLILKELEQDNEVGRKTERET